MPNIVYDPKSESDHNILINTSTNIECSYVYVPVHTLYKYNVGKYLLENKLVGSLGAIVDTS